MTIVIDYDMLKAERKLKRRSSGRHWGIVKSQYRRVSNEGVKKKFGRAFPVYSSGKRANTLQNSHPKVFAKDLRTERTGQQEYRGLRPTPDLAI